MGRRKQRPPARAPEHEAEDVAAVRQRQQARFARGLPLGGTASAAAAAAPEPDAVPPKKRRKQGRTALPAAAAPRPEASDVEVATVPLPGRAAGPAAPDLRALLHLTVRSAGGLEHVFHSALTDHQLECSATDAGGREVVGRAALDAPSEVARALHELVVQKQPGVAMLVALEPADPGPGHAACTATLRLFLTRRAFDAGPRLADERATRVFHRQLKVVMDWCRPDCGPDAVGLSDADYGFLRDRRPGAGRGEGEGADLSTSSINSSVIFDYIKPKGDEPMLADHFRELVPVLRPYQRRAAAWMVQRENGAAPREPPLHPLWTAVAPIRGDPFYYNPFSGQVSRTAFRDRQVVSGGILADEMGLGKTVEVLACVVANPHRGAVKAEAAGPDAPPGDPRASLEVDCPCGAAHPKGEASAGGSHEGLWVQCGRCGSWQHGKCVGYKHAGEVPVKYACGRCARALASATVEGQAASTLIVCPDPILSQWEHEIARHVANDDLKVLAYRGQSQAAGQGGDAAQVLTAADLARADIVLTTYDVLRREVHNDADPQAGHSLAKNRPMRRQKRYQIIPTPLTRLKWWRVCLDEAQMVETSTAAAAQMALKLHTRHRWCVTGTPVSKGLEDLYGLLLFLGVDPYSDRKWWQLALERPLAEGSAAALGRAKKLLQPLKDGGGLLWRTRKQDVARELGLKPQHVVVHRLRLSAVERHFYKRQHQECAAAARTALPAAWESLSRHAANFKDRPLRPTEANKVLHKLLLLRQACCHPQVGSLGVKALSHHAPMTMDEILDMLIAKARIEAEDSQRLLFFALNGLAAVMILQGNHALAVGAYREVLACQEEQLRGGVRMDALQKLHTVHNLRELLQAAHPGVVPTLRDGALQEEADAISRHFLEVHRARLLQSHAELEDVAQEVRRARAACKASKARGWWQDALRLLSGLVRPAQDPEEEEPEEYAEDFVRALKVHLTESVAAGTSRDGANASSLARRFRDVAGLGFTLSAELQKVEASRTTLMAEVHRLYETCRSEPSKELIYEASHCSRCRAEFAEAELVCDYCRLDEPMMEHEARLFSLRTTATERGAEVTMDMLAHRMDGAWGATTRAHQFDNVHAAGADVGRGARGRAREGPGRGGGVARAEVFHRPSDCEQVLKFLHAQLRKKFVRRALVACDSNGEEEEAEEEAEEAAEEDAEDADGGDEEDEEDADGEGGEDGRPSRLEWSSPVQISAEDLQALLDRGREHLALLEAMRGEFVPCRTFTRYQRQWLYAHDELAMANSRMHVVPDDEAIPAELANFKLHRAELPVRNGELTDQKALHQADLNRAMGTLRYLEGLAAARRRGQGGVAETQCPICQEDGRAEVSVLPCGHQMCSQCTLVLIERGKSSAGPPKRISCPTCRQLCPVAEIAYVERGQDRHGEAAVAGGGPGPDAGAPEEAADAATAAVRVRGSYGTKIEAVTRQALRLLAADPGARVLVFSQWSDVLDLVAHAFRANGVTFAHAKGRKRMAEALATFKAVGSGVAALLMPLNLGGNGLNLTEAQHVLLVEPQLDPGIESQAFGRVDRIGQTKETFVHRFVVQDTVEESAARLCQQRAAAAALKGTVSKAAARGAQAGQPRLLLSEVCALLAGNV